MLTRETESLGTQHSALKTNPKENFSSPPNPKKFFRFVNRVMIKRIKDTGRNMNFLKIGSVATQPIDFSTIPPDMWVRNEAAKYIALRTADNNKPVLCKDTLDALCHQCPATANTILYALEQTTELLKTHSMRKVGAVLLVKLEAGGCITGSNDTHYFHCAYLPLKAEPEVLTTCNGNARHLPVGELYTFNQDKPHSIANGSNKDYIYLTVDYA